MDDLPRRGHHHCDSECALCQSCASNIFYSQFAPDRTGRHWHHYWILGISPHAARFGIIFPPQSLSVTPPSSLYTSLAEFDRGFASFASQRLSPSWLSNSTLHYIPSSSVRSWFCIFIHRLFQPFAIYFCINHSISCASASDQNLPCLYCHLHVALHVHFGLVFFPFSFAGHFLRHDFT